MGGLDKGDFTRVTPGMDAMFLGGLLVSGECCICSKNFRSYIILVPRRSNNIKHLSHYILVLF